MAKPFDLDDIQRIYLIILEIFIVPKWALFPCAHMSENVRKICTVNEMNFFKTEKVSAWSERKSVLTTLKGNMQPWNLTERYHGT